MWKTDEVGCSLNRICVQKFLALLLFWDFVFWRTSSDGCKWRSEPQWFQGVFFFSLGKFTYFVHFVIFFVQSFVERFETPDGFAVGIWIWSVFWFLRVEIFSDFKSASWGKWCICRFFVLVCCCYCSFVYGYLGSGIVFLIGEYFALFLENLGLFCFWFWFPVIGCYGWF